MIFINNIFGRVSTRDFAHKKIEDEKIETILKAAMAAPSANNKQPWHFIVIRNRETFKKIMEFHPYSGMIDSADTLIAALGDLNIEENIGYLAVNLAAATENILLCAEDLNIGSCWLGIYPREERISKLKAILNLPENIIPISLVALGYKNKTVKQEDRFNKDRVRYEKWL